MHEVRITASEYPVVTLLGPRQSGKTTLVKACFPDHGYCNLEHPEKRRLAQSDPNSFLKSYPTPVILDEIQRVPELLSYIQVRVDEVGGKGQYILTGSHQLSLHEAVSQSLAGRTGILTLWPLSLEELQAMGLSAERDDWIYRGFFPRIYDEGIQPTRHYRSYLQTYVERDVRQVLQIRDLGLFEQFLYVLAGRVGQVLNMQSMANDLGVAGKTLKQWISVLEASFVVFQVRPYFENFGKRLVKSPKIYFTDSGFLSFLLGVESPAQVARDPLLGALFENLVVTEAMKALLNRGRLPHLYYFRDNAGNEVDLIYGQGRTITPIEIKAGRTWNADFLKGIRFLQRQSDKVGKGVVLYSGDLEPDLESAKGIHFTKTASIFS